MKQTRALGDPAYADGELQPVADRRGSLASDDLCDTQSLVGDSSLSDLVVHLHREFNNLPVPLCHEILDWLKDQGALVIGSRSSRSFRLAEWQTAFIRILAYEIHHPAMTDLFAVRYIWNEPLLDDQVNHMNPAQFAAKIGVSREAVNKAVLRAQKYFKQPPRRGQRCPVARENMRQARMKQLKPGGGGRKAEVRSRNKKKL